MAIAGINTTTGVFNPTGSATRTAGTGDEVEFSKNVMKCVAEGGRKVMLCSDALMSYASPQTGESVNIYRAENYSESGLFGKRIGCRRK